MRFPETADLWRPLLAPARVQLHQVRNLDVFARLAPGVTRAEAQREMYTISLALQVQRPETNRNIEAQVMTFGQRFTKAQLRLVFMSMLGAVAFVLPIVCANVANLLLARSVYRAREIAVRTALGATRARIVRQLLIESVLLACLGGVGGLGLTFMGVRLFDAIVSDSGKPYWMVFDLDVLVFGYFAAVVLATGITFGLAPTLQASRINPYNVMKEGGHPLAGGSRTRWLTSGLVVLELTLTLALLTGAGLMVRSFLKLYTLDPGVESSRVLTMRTHLIAAKYPKPPMRQLFFDEVQTRLRAIPGATSAAIASALPLSRASSVPIQIEGRPTELGEIARRVELLAISPSYFETMGVGIVQGRGFVETDGEAGADAVIVNQRLAAELFPGEAPLGRRIRMMTGDDESRPGPWLTIVGISPTIRQGNLESLRPAPVMYQPYRVDSAVEMVILLRTAGEPALQVNAVREAVKAIDPDQPLFALRPLDSVLQEARLPYRVFGSLFVIFALIALVLSSVGIYAVTAYTVTRRTQEIGVRVALGAQAGQISWLVLRDGLIQLAFGLVLGLVGAWGVSNLLASLVVHIPPVDPVTFVTITLLLAAVTLAACLIPARRATRLDPIAALRDE